MNVPIIISGGGIIGNYIALRLEKNNIDSIIIEKSESSSLPQNGIRTVTLNENSIQLLKDVGITPKFSKVELINVFDGEGSGKIKFAATDINAETLSYVIYFDELHAKTLNLCRKRTYFKNQINTIQNFNSESNSEVILQDDTLIKTSVIAGCDGRNSNVAKISSLSSQSEDYFQTAITFIVETDGSQKTTAHQVFSDRGIFALMPAPDYKGKANSFTVVWSVSNSDLEGKEISEYVSKNITFFESKLCMQLRPISDILNFRLTNHHFENYINGSVVLIGDAAHSIHPLAGQGINLGFADADVFCEEIINAYKKGISINEKSVLKRYEIRRKAMNLLMLRSMDFFIDLFGSKNLYVRLIRNFGLSAVNKSKFMKTFFIRQASGVDKP